MSFRDLVFEITAETCSEKFLSWLRYEFDNNISSNDVPFEIAKSENKSISATYFDFELGKPDEEETTILIISTNIECSYFDENQNVKFEYIDEPLDLIEINLLQNSETTLYISFLVSSFNIWAFIIKRFKDFEKVEFNPDKLVIPFCKYLLIKISQNFRVLEQNNKFDDGIDFFRFVYKEQIAKYSDESMVDSDSDIGDKSNTKEAWEKIPDVNWDRVALKYWIEGYTALEIQQRTYVASARRITNRLCELRKLYGKEIVPYNKERRQYKKF